MRVVVTETVSGGGGAVRVEVIDDGGTGTPRVVIPRADAESGFGLGLVQQACDQWGSYVTGCGRTVWASVTLP